MLELLGQMKPFKCGGQMVSPFQFLITIPTIGHNRQRQTALLLLEDITRALVYIWGGFWQRQYIRNLGLHIFNLKWPENCSD